MGADSGGSSGGSSDKDKDKKKDTTPTFANLNEAAAAGYHGQAVNIAGKGLQKVEFADKDYDAQMSNVSDTAITTDKSSTSTSSAFDWTPNLQHTNFSENVSMSLGFTEPTEGFYADQVITTFNNLGPEAAQQRADYLNQSGLLSQGSTLINDTMANLSGGGTGFVPLGTGSSQTGKTKTTDSKSFDQAFGDARGAGQSTFTWKGNQYTTELAPSTPSGVSGDDPYLDASGAATATYPNYGPPGTGSPATLPGGEITQTSIPLSPEQQRQQQELYDSSGGLFGSNQGLSGDPYLDASGATTASYGSTTNFPTYGPPGTETTIVNPSYDASLDLNGDGAITPAEQLATYNMFGDVVDDYQGVSDDVLAQQATQAAGTSGPPTTNYDAIDSSAYPSGQGPGNIGVMDDYGTVTLPGGGQTASTLFYDSLGSPYIAGTTIPYASQNAADGADIMRNLGPTVPTGNQIVPTGGSGVDTSTLAGIEAASGVTPDKDPTFFDDVKSGLSIYGDIYKSAGGGFWDMLSNTLEGSAKYGDMFASALTPTKGDKVTVLSDLVGSGGYTGEDTGALKFLQDTAQNVRSSMTPGMEERIDQNATFHPDTTLKELLTGQAKMVGGGGMFDDPRALVVKGFEDAYDTGIDVLSGLGLGKKAIPIIMAASTGEAFNSASEGAQNEVSKFVSENPEVIQMIAESKHGGDRGAAEQEIRGAADLIAGAVSGPVGGLGDTLLASGVGKIATATGLSNLPKAVKVPAGGMFAGWTGGVTEYGEKVGENLAANRALGIPITVANLTKGAAAQGGQGVLGQGTSGSVSTGVASVLPTSIGNQVTISPNFPNYGPPGGVTNIIPPSGDPGAFTTSDNTTTPIVDLGTAGTAAQAPPTLLQTGGPGTFPVAPNTASTQEMIIADAAIGSIIENSVDADGNVVLSGETVNQLKAVSDQTGITAQQIENIIRTKGFTVDLTTPIETDQAAVAQTISNIIAGSPTDQASGLKVPSAEETAVIATLANNVGMSKNELDNIVANNNGAPYISAVAADVDAAANQGLDESGLEIPAAEVYKTKDIGVTDDVFFRGEDSGRSLEGFDADTSFTDPIDGSIILDEKGDGIYMTKSPDYASTFANARGAGNPMVYKIRLKEGTKLFDYQSENDLKVAEDFYNKNKKKIDNSYYNQEKTFMEDIKIGDYNAFENPFGEKAPGAKSENFQAYLQEQGYDGHKTGDTSPGSKKEFGNVKVYSGDSLVSAFDSSLQQQQQFATAGTDPAGIASVDPNADTTVDFTVDPNADTTVNVDAAVDAAVDPNVDVTTGVTTDVTTDVNPGVTTDVITDVNPETETSTMITTDQPFEEDEDEIIVETTEEEDEVTTDPPPSVPPGTYDETPPVGPIVPPESSTDENGDPVYSCPEGYKLVKGADGMQCFRTTTEQRMRKGIGTRAYTRVNPSRYRRGQRSVDLQKTESTPVIVET